MNPSVVSLTLTAGVANGISLAQTPGAAGNLTITGSLAAGGIATLSPARRVQVSSTGTETASFTIYGTNRSGAAISSTVSGVTAAAPQTTALDFLTVTRVAISGAGVGSITVGTNSVGSTEWVLDNFLAPSWYLSVAVSVAGTGNYTVEHTYDDPNALMDVGSQYPLSMEPASNVPPIAWPNTNLTAQTINKEAQYAQQPIFAHRLTVNSGTGTATMQSIQAGIGSP